jgi:hypothetical protein
MDARIRKIESAESQMLNICLRADRRGLIRPGLHLSGILILGTGNHVIYQVLAQTLRRLIVDSLLRDGGSTAIPRFQRVYCGPQHKHVTNSMYNGTIKHPEEWRLHERRCPITG